ncbi:MAG: PHP domain-containing protein [Myxococcaceae bacterium]
MSDRPRKRVSALGYALPALVALGVIGGYTAFAVSRAKGSLGKTELATSQPAVDPGDVRWLKGALHVHTNQSGDSKEPVENVIAAYEKAGFDFVVLTDHNNVTVGKGTDKTLVIPGVELTLNLPSCEPPPEDDRGCAVHVNAWFVDPKTSDRIVIEPRSRQRYDLYASLFQAARMMGGLFQVNHPNYKYTGANVELLAKLQPRFLEIGNAALDVNTAGDAQHPPVEHLWDELLTQIRQPVWGTATDDAHDYSDAAAVAKSGANPSIVDQGYVFVRARKDPKDIREALERGDFYASQGPRLDEVAVKDGALLIRTAEEATFRFIGEGGKDLQTTTGKEARYVPADPKPLYIRAVIDQGGHRAWTQPWFPAAPR